MRRVASVVVVDNSIVSCNPQPAVAWQPQQCLDEEDGAVVWKNKDASLMKRNERAPWLGIRQIILFIWGMRWYSTIMEAYTCAGHQPWMDNQTRYTIFARPSLTRCAIPLFADSLEVSRGFDNIFSD